MASKAGKMFKWGQKDPELYVLMAIYAGIFGAAGFHLGKKGGNAKPETNVALAPNSMPWEGEDADENSNNPNYKYEYHPQGDPNNAPRQAPGALHSHTIMASLPLDLHEKFNKSIE